MPAAGTALEGGSDAAYIVQAFLLGAGLVLHYSFVSHWGGRQACVLPEAVIGPCRMRAAAHRLQHHRRHAVDVVAVVDAHACAPARLSRMQLKKTSPLPTFTALAVLTTRDGCSAWRPPLQHAICTHTRGRQGLRKGGAPRARLMCRPEPCTATRCCATVSDICASAASPSIRKLSSGTPAPACRRAARRCALAWWEPGLARRKRTARPGRPTP